MGNPLAGAENTPKCPNRMYSGIARRRCLDNAITFHIINNNGRASHKIALFIENIETIGAQSLKSPVFCPKLPQNIYICNSNHIAMRVIWDKSPEVFYKIA